LDEEMAPIDVGPVIERAKIPKSHWEKNFRDFARACTGRSGRTTGVNPGVARVLDKYR
jgi:hypothetical protein